MKEIIRLHSAYDLWANTLVMDRLQRLGEDLLDRPVASSFPSLRSTVLHIRDAGNAWYQRVAGPVAKPYAEGATHLGSLLKLCTAFDKAVQAMEEKQLLEQVTYTNSKGATFSQPRWQLLMHVFNHATYHRGQLVTIMHQLGLGEIPATDLVAYQRLRGKEA